MASLIFCEGAGNGDAPVRWHPPLHPEELRTYLYALDAVHAEGLPFALGGGLAFSYHARRWRNSKDLDLFVMPRDRAAVVEALTAVGFADYHVRSNYDRSWIYRSYMGDVIVDVIWTFPNHRGEVDEHWFQRAALVQLHGSLLPIIPVEELIWAKLYVLQRDRSDWPDLLNVLKVNAASIDWQHLMRRVGGDAGLLGGLISVFRWLAPEDAHRVPEWVCSSVGLLNYGPSPDGIEGERAARLDIRDWWGPKQEEGRSC